MTKEIVYQDLVGKMKLAIANHQAEFADAESDDQISLIKGFSIASGRTVDDIRKALDPDGLQNDLPQTERFLIRNKFTEYVEQLNPRPGTYDLPKVTRQEAKSFVESQVRKHLPGFEVLNEKLGQRRFEFDIGNPDGRCPIRFVLVLEKTPVALVRIQLRLGLTIVGDISTIFSDFRRPQVIEKDDFFYWISEWLRYSGVIRSYLARQPELGV